MSTRDTSGSAPQHSHPYNNTVSRNENFWVDQVTVPHTPRGEGQGWGRTLGGWEVHIHVSGAVVKQGHMQCWSRKMWGICEHHALARRGKNKQQNK